MPVAFLPVIMGIFGEAGSAMAPAKKLHREGVAYVTYFAAAEEEFGDLFWYFAALARRLDMSIVEIFEKLEYAEPSIVGAQAMACALPSNEVDSALTSLGSRAARFLALNEPNLLKDEMSPFAGVYLDAVRATGLSFAAILRRNLGKTEGRFVDPDPALLPTFDSGFDEEERIPDKFAIRFIQRKSGRCHLQMNGVFIGDPLTDNIAPGDNYRFHDVFHMAYAAILHWSPVLRALLKRKRKSVRHTDENEDGGRAIVVEEGVSALLFSYAKQVNYFEGATSVPYDLLKQVEQFTKGYQVEECPLRLWERAILDGYQAFRSMRDEGGGIIDGDRSARSISFRSTRN
ncbi:hypothetical protein DSM104443_03202 [Usitatibacter rugosus]|uniref:MazG C-terminal domain-containing protein n=2 Tax=Usitatibacter rugosus TaxID=2732067 RepID=A0A6M4GYZ5_9PROT|nr:hypothetical protein DSM104443_03202 [Usitatibacter rugosus]